MPASFNFTIANWTITYTVDETYLNLLSFKLDQKIFSYKKFLGAGTYGRVNLYEQEALGESPQQFLAIKTPQKPLEGSDPGSSESGILHINELKALENNYKDEGVFAICFHNLPKSTTFAYVMIMPFFVGLALNKALSSVTSEVKLILMVLATIKEIHRTHLEKNIIHGDLKEDNLLIDEQIKVHLLDFHFSNLCTNQSSRLPYNIHINDKYVDSYAPERFQDAKPDPSQDVFSIAYMLRRIILHSNHWLIGVDYDLNNSQFYPPCILDFCNQGLSAVPAHRPTLESLIQALESRQAQFYIDAAVHFVWRPGSFFLRLNHSTFVFTQEFVDSKSLVYEFKIPYGLIRVKFRADYDLNEANFNGMVMMRKIYPGAHDSVYQIHSLYRHPAYSANQPYTCFEITPLFLGITLNKLQLSRKSEKDFLRYCLAICSELQRIHDLDKGYLHGNIKGDKIIVNETLSSELPEVHFIEFECGYRHDALSATTYDCESAHYFAPERRKIQKLAPQFNQDLYSLSKTFQALELGVQPHAASRIVRAFCLQAMEYDPAKRPQNLKAFILNLQQRLHDIEPPERLNVMPNFSSPLIAGLDRRRRWSSLRFFGENRPDLDNEEVMQPAKKVKYG